MQAQDQKPAKAIYFQSTPKAGRIVTDLPLTKWQRLAVDQLSQTALEIWQVYLAKTCGGKREAPVKHADVMAATGHSKSTVQRAKDQLIGLGLLASRPRWFTVGINMRKQVSNAYRIPLGKGAKLAAILLKAAAAKTIRVIEQAAEAIRERPSTRGTYVAKIRDAGLMVFKHEQARSIPSVLEETAARSGGSRQSKDSLAAYYARQAAKNRC